MFADHWQQKVRDDDYNRLGELLGVRWTRDMVESLFIENKLGDAKKSKRPNEVTFPLAAIIEPTLQDHVKKIFGRKYGLASPEWAREEQEENFVDMFSVPKEEFRKFMGGFLPMAMANDPEGMHDPHVSLRQWQSPKRRKIQRRAAPSGPQDLPDWARNRSGK